MICKVEGCENDAHPDKDGECYRHAVAGVGIAFRGPIVGRRGWNQHTTRTFHEEHLGVSGGKELARTRPDIERAR